MTEAEIRNLLADLGWLRALARRLVRDASTAEDLVQEACAIALRQSSPPQQGRAWLTGVVKNLFRAHLRDRRRQLRNLAAARAPDAEDARTVVQRAETHQMLANVVLQLEEPYRSTVLLRFFDGKPPRKIAALHGVPVATVHSRLQRALHQMRTQLDDGAGDRRQWLALVVPVAWPTRGALVLTVTRRAVSRWWGVAGVFVLALGLAQWVWRGQPSPGATTTATAKAAAAPTMRDGLAATERLRVPPPDPAVARELLAVRGFVRDCTGTGVEGARVSARRGDLWAGGSVGPGDLILDFATTAADGSFVGHTDASSVVLQVQDPRWEAVLSGAWSRDAYTEPLVVVAPRTAVEGYVVDGEGRPVLQGQLSMRLPPDALAQLALDLEGAAQTSYHASCAPDGRFRFAGLPYVPGARLVVAAAGCATASVPVPASPMLDLRIELAPIVATAGDLEGLVLGRDGAPAAGARVALGVTSVTADRRGRFVLRLQRAGRPTDLVAALPGFGPARVVAPEEGGDLVECWPHPLVLQLGAPTGVVRGRIVDGNGPVVGAEVWIADPTPFAIVGKHPILLEYFLGGAPLRTRGRPLLPLDGEDGDFVGSPVLDDVVIPGLLVHQEESTATWQYVETDANGAFTLPGLLDRGYTVRAFDPRTLRTAAVAGAVADADLELVLPPPLATDLRGRVVSPVGQPLDKVLVRQDVAVFMVAARVPDGLYRVSMLRSGPRIATAADGTFRLPGIRSDQWMLSFDGPQVLSGESEGRDIDLTRETVFSLERRCRLVVALAHPHEADAVSFVDDAGQPVDARIQNLRNSRSSSSRVPLHEGRSGPLELGERVARCVLWRRGVVVREVHLAPLPGSTTHVQ